MADLGCKKVWSGDTGFGGVKSYTVVCSKTDANKPKAEKPNIQKENTAQTKDQYKNSPKKECTLYVGDSGFLGAIKSLLWTHCTSK